MRKGQRKRVSSTRRLFLIFSHFPPPVAQACILLHGEEDGEAQAQKVRHHTVQLAAVPARQLLGQPVLGRARHAQHLPRKQHWKGDGEGKTGNGEERTQDMETERVIETEQGRES
jgi:hypothetical protein